MAGAAVRAGYRTLWRTATNTFRGDTRAIVAGRMELRDHVEKERNEKDPAKIGEGVIEGRRLPASVGGTVWRGLGGVLNVRGRRHACCAMISGLLFVHAYCRRPSLCFTPLLSFRVTTSNVPPSLLLNHSHTAYERVLSRNNRGTHPGALFSHDRDRARVNASP